MRTAFRSLRAEAGPGVSLVSYCIPCKFGCALCSMPPRRNLLRNGEGPLPVPPLNVSHRKETHKERRSDLLGLKARSPKGLFPRVYLLVVPCVVVVITNYPQSAYLRFSVTFQNQVLFQRQVLGSKIFPLVADVFFTYIL